MKTSTLYTYDTKLNIRIWYMETNPEDESQYRSVSGLETGKKIVGAWTTAKAKNTGRSNARTAEEQAESEIQSALTKQLKSGYALLRDMAGVTSFFEPMLAHKLDEKNIKRTPDMVFYQPKLDGIRCIINRLGMFTRTGEQIISCQHIVESTAPFFAEYPEAVLDGELYNHELKDNFNKIQGMITTRTEKKLTAEFLAEVKNYVQFHCYDFPILLNDADMKDGFKGRLDRIQMLKGIPYVVEVPTFYDQLQKHGEYFVKFTEDGYEGSMVRTPDGPYKQGRSNDLMKDKAFQDKEFTLADIVPGEGKWANAAKSVRYYLEDGRIASAGVKGKYADNVKLLAVKVDYIDGDVTIQFQNLTPDGVPRFPIAKAFYKGKRNK